MLFQWNMEEMLLYQAQKKEFKKLFMNNLEFFSYKMSEKCLHNW